MFEKMGTFDNRALEISAIFNYDENIEDVEFIANKIFLFATRKGAQRISHKKKLLNACAPKFNLILKYRNLHKENP